MNQILATQNQFFLRKQNIFVREKSQKKYDCKSEINFHIESDDYFGTLATILDLMVQERNRIDKKHLEVLKSIKKNLIYLQKNYKIVKKRNS